MTVVKTPCIGICSTSIGDAVCRGCKRFNHEVFHWNAYTDREKANVAERLEALMEKVMQRYVVITDSEKLEEAIERYGLQRHPATTATAKAYLLLRALSKQDPEANPRCLQATGILLTQPAHSQSLGELFSRIDGEFHELSLAYYDANFLRAYRLRKPENYQA